MTPQGHVLKTEIHHKEIYIYIYIYIFNKCDLPFEHGNIPIKRGVKTWIILYDRCILNQ